MNKTIILTPDVYKKLKAVLCWAHLYDIDKNSAKNKAVYEAILKEFNYLEE